MAINLASLKRVSATMPPRILLYGPPGIGKTTLASEFPNAVFLQIEDGTPGDAELTTFGKLETYGDVIEALGALYQEEHGFQTVVIDSVTELQRLIYAETCARGDDEGKTYERMEDFPWGGGYKFATNVWQEFIAGLNMLRDDRRMAIVLIAHSAIQEHKDPETPAFDQYQIALHSPKKSDSGRADHRGLLERWTDAIILLKRNIVIKHDDKAGMAAKNAKTTVRVRASGGDIVMMRTKGTATINAKNRYGMPEEIRYDRGEGFAALAPYLPGFDASATINTENKEAA
jgi:DNA polymerase III delta prime subunit